MIQQHDLGNSTFCGAGYRRTMNRNEATLRRANSPMTKNQREDIECSVVVPGKRLVRPGTNFGIEVGGGWRGKQRFGLTIAQGYGRSRRG